MNRGTGGGVVAAGFSLLFFTFLFGPLIIMVITAFNSSSSRGSRHGNASRRIGLAFSSPMTVL